MPATPLLACVTAKGGTRFLLRNPHSTRDAPALWANGLIRRVLRIVCGDTGSPHVNWPRYAPLRKVASCFLIYHAYTGKNPKPTRGGVFQWPDWPRRPVAITIP